MFVFTALFTDTAASCKCTLGYICTFVIISQHFLITRHKSFRRATIARHNIKHVLWRAIAARVAFYSRQGLMQEHFFKHFNCMEQNGFLNNVSITLIDKTGGKNPKQRDYWKRTLKIYFPFKNILAFVTFIFIDYGFLEASQGSSVLVELHVYGMQFYQQGNLLRLYGTAVCGGVYFQ